jgi:hypothetical protein
MGIVSIYSSFFSMKNAVKMPAYTSITIYGCKMWLLQKYVVSAEKLSSASDNTATPVSKSSSRES